MNPLKKLKAFRAVPQKTDRPSSFTYKGVIYATPSEHTEQIPGFWISDRGKAWAATKETL